MPTEAELRATFEAAGQSHVFAHWDACDEAERASLLQQLGAIGDLDRVSSVFRRSMADPRVRRVVQGATSRRVKADAVAGDQDRSTSWRAAGLRAAREGKLAVILLAGGQGTRLGSADPKGMYDVGLPSGRTLFRMQAERLLKLGREAAKAGAPDDDTAKTIPPARIPWYIMTSPFTHDATEAHFEANAYFGLNSEDVTFFQQEGSRASPRRERSSCAPSVTSPRRRTVTAGCTRRCTGRRLADMRRRGVEHVHAYCVDNALVKVGDPEYVGFCLERGVDAGAKVISKAYPEEPVGVFTRRGGKVHVVEYSELPADLATAEDPGHAASFASTPPTSCCTTTPSTFSAKCCEPDGGVQASLVYHVARKKVPHGFTRRRNHRDARETQRGEARGVHIRRVPVRGKSGVPSRRSPRGFRAGEERRGNGEGLPGHGARGGFRASPRMDRERGRTCRGRGTRRSAGGVVRGRGTRGYLRGTHVRRAGSAEEHAWVLARDKRRRRRTPGRKTREENRRELNR